MSSRWKPYFNINRAAPAISPGVTADTTETTIALSSQYSYMNGGSAVMFTWACPRSANLTAVYFKVRNYVGNWGSTDGQITLEVRDGIAATNRPGSVLVSSQNVTLDGTTIGWVKATLSSPVALSMGKLYSLVLGDTDGGASNHVVLSIRLGSAAITRSIDGPSTTTDGFNTGASPAGGPVLALEVGGDIFSTGGITSVVSQASSTIRRGSKFTPWEDCVLAGVHFSSDTNALSSWTVQVFDDATPPNGTPLHSASIPSNTLGGTTPVPSLWLLDSWYLLRAGRTYRIVFLPSTARTVPRKAFFAEHNNLWELVDAATSRCMWTEALTDGSGWVDDRGAMCAWSPVLIPARPPATACAA